MILIKDCRKQFSLGERILYARVSKLLTQTDLARNLEVSKAVVESWESGVAAPERDYITALCDQLGVDREYLFDTDDSEIINQRLSQQADSRIPSLS